MSLVNLGAPQNEMEFLARRMGLSVFFEGGTYKGGTALHASKTFQTVITVERSEAMFLTARTNINGASNIEMLKGDTRDHLPKVINRYDNILFWLDAHWSGGDTYGETDECPLLTELRIIFSSKLNCVVLIDDARLFLAPPPKPHKLEHWPSVNQIVDVLPAEWDLIVYEDVIYLIPNTISREFREFLQPFITEQWLRESRSTVFSRLIRLLHKWEAKP